MAAYQVRQGDIFGRVGSGLGSGLAEQLPQEMDRYRLSKGLQEIDNNPNLTPAQRYGKLLTLPGLTPQGLQGYSELMQRKMMGDAMNPPNQPSPFPEKSVKEEATNSEIPSLTKEDSFAKAQEGFIPRTEEQKLDAAGTRFKSNPALFKNDPQRAIDYENQIDATNEKIAAANQTKHQNLTHIQDNVVKRLGKYSEDLGVDIPTNVYSKIEDKAIQATKPRSEGGGGLTEQQAMKEYGKELDAVSRDYSAIDALGGWGVVNRPAKNTLSSIQALQDKFEKRGDTENFADTLISKGKFSPLQAYSMAQPVKKVPALNNELFKLKDVFSTRTEDPVFETKSIAPKLAKNLGQKGSPLAVAYELKRKGYDANTWLDYLQENREELNLQDWQGRQLDKPRNLLPEFNDWWLNAWSGIDKLKEEKIMQPYQAATEEMKWQSEAPSRLAKKAIGTAGTLAGASTIGRVMPFLSEYIPADLAIKGLSKIDPRFGTFINTALQNGKTFDEVKDFIGEKVQSEEISQEPAKEGRNILQQYSPLLFKEIEQYIKKGKTPFHAAQMARNMNSSEESAIKKMETDHKAKFFDIVDAVFGNGQATQPMQPQQQMQQPQAQQMQQGKPQQNSADWGQVAQQLQNILKM